MTEGASQTAYIVTGTTRGIGKALVEELLSRGDDRVFSLSRAPEGQAGAWHNVHCDLLFAEQVEQAMQRLLEALGCRPWREVVLISNAGVLTPIGFLDSLTTAQTAAHMQVNLLAPIQILRLFMARTREWSCRRFIVAMTSGAARHPYAGWSLYCSAKAALDMMVRCVALEQQNVTNGAGICAVAPGVVDTEMQAEIRNASDADFPSRSQFVQFQMSGKLVAPQWVAATLLDLYRNEQLVSGAIYDLRDVRWQAGRPTIEPRPGKV